MSRLAMSGAVFVCTLVSSSIGATLHVPADYPSIQSCIDAAAAGFDECVVAPGTYHETIDFHGKAITVRSSDGSGTTTIDATGLDSSVVACITSEGADTVLDGFTITGGTGNLLTGTRTGGGMFNYNSSPTVTNCVFTGNSAVEGGGMDNYILSYPTVTHCTFIDNHAHIGGGMLNFEGSPAVTDCTFEHNDAATGGGGGMANFLYGKPIVTGCIFHENNADLGGGMYNDLDSIPTVMNCIFTENTSFYGGGVYNLESNPILDHCEFRENTSQSDGGAIYNYDMAGATITDCTFTENVASGVGGAIYSASDGYWGKTKVVNCTFTGNRAENGGTMFNDQYSDAVLSNCIFDRNEAIEGGGIYNANDATLSLSDCRFSGNTANDGAGEYNEGWTKLTNSDFDGNIATTSGGGISSPYVLYGAPKLTAVNCAFNGNQAHDGGGIYNEGGALKLTGCEFNENVANQGGGIVLISADVEVDGCSFIANRAESNGGGIMAYIYDNTKGIHHCTFRGNQADQGGGICIEGGSETNIFDCIFANNSAYGGGGIIQIDQSRTLVMDCQFLGNHAESTGGGMASVDGIDYAYVDCLFSGNTALYGAAMGGIADAVTVTGCTLSGNAASESGGGLYGYDGTSILLSDCILWGNLPDEITTEDSTATIRYSDVQGGLPQGTLDGGGNVDHDPMFLRPPNPGPDCMWNGVNDDYGDLRLQSGSPCINAGNLAFTPRADETDLEGHSRVLCERVDMGSYEFGIGDYDCDQTVNIVDFANWSLCERGPRIGVSSLDPSCAAFDFDGDGDVDLSDFSRLQDIIQH
ncbi:MAG: right-handed parallel beta-helix repeat-containing protein [Planctomycetes bacterium]|nr:right-handed parallel beta-helix repeat-containing protein [Planctomycetota bacterium]MBI3834393.1 right-handed parallel beta-helix repeat-containing protein [Planctomycetota bacterium]